MEENNVNQLTNTDTNSTNQTEKKQDGTKKKGGQIVLMIFLLVCLAGIGYLLYNRLTKTKTVDLKALPSVNVTHIRRGSIEKEISVTGTILPNDTYYVVAKVGGDITKIYVKNGDHVKKGDPICEIDASKEIEAAFILYDTAKSSYERMEKLYHAGDISKASFESVKAQYDSYKLAYETKVEYATPVAVADGVVENTDMIENTSIKTEKVLCYITSKESKEINFGVTERVLDGIKIGDKCTIEKSGKTYDGYISNIANLIDSTTGLFKVKAVITSPNNFASGVMAKVTFPYEKRRNIDVLPNEVIYYEAGSPYVYVVGDEDVLTKKYIEVGIENEDNTEIITKLDRNLKIVSTWNNDLAEGSKVKIVNDEKVEDEKYIESKANEIIEKLPDRMPLRLNNIATKSDIASASQIVKEELPKEFDGIKEIIVDNQSEAR